MNYKQYLADVDAYYKQLSKLTLALQKHDQEKYTMLSVLVSSIGNVIDHPMAPTDGNGELVRHNLELQQRLEASDARNKELLAECAERDKHISDMQEEEWNSTIRITRLQDELAEALTRNSELEERRQKEEYSNTLYRNKLADFNAELIERIDELKHANSDSLDMMCKDNELLHDKLDIALDNCALLQHKLGLVQDELELLRITNRRLESSVDALTAAPAKRSE